MPPKFRNLWNLWNIGDWITGAELIRWRKEARSYSLIQLMISCHRYSALDVIPPLRRLAARIGAFGQLALVIVVGGAEQQPHGQHRRGPVSVALENLCADGGIHPERLSPRLRK